MNWVCSAIEPISAHSRESGDPGAENSAKELGPRVRARACTDLKTGTTGLSAPLPRVAKRSGGGGVGGGGCFLAINRFGMEFYGTCPIRRGTFGAA